jgi:hypothetical protein
LFLFDFYSFEVNSKVLLGAVNVKVARVAVKVQVFEKISKACDRDSADVVQAGAVLVVKVWALSTVVNVSRIA